MSDLWRVFQQPEWARPNPTAVNPLPFSPNVTPPRNFLTTPYADPPHAGGPAEYIPSMYPFPENTIGVTCPMQRPTPCVQPMPCNIQPIPNTNALQCCARPNPNYGSAVYRQETINTLPQSQQQVSPQVAPPQSPLSSSNGMVMYRQSSFDSSQYESIMVLLRAQADRIRYTEYILIALVILIIVGLIFMKK